MTTAQSVYARPGPHGDQIVEVVVDHGYRPQSIVARAGVPLRLVFRRRDDDTCTDRIVFSSPHLDRRLARGAETTVVLPAQPPGEIRFACGMGRYHGQIELRADRSPALAVIRARAVKGSRRVWRFIHGLAEPTGADGALDDRCARSARGEIGRGVSERAPAEALAAQRGHDHDT